MAALDSEWDLGWQDISLWYTSDQEWMAKTNFRVA